MESAGAVEWEKMHIHSSKNKHLKTIQIWKRQKYRTQEREKKKRTWKRNDSKEMAEKNRKGAKIPSGLQKHIWKKRQ